MFRNTKKRAQRRGWPIIGFCGPNGGGKSAAMVWDTLPSLEAGRRVLSTVRILDYRDPRECPGCDEPGHDRWLRVATPEYRSFLEGLGPAESAKARRVFPDEDKWTEVYGGVHGAAHPSYESLRDWEQLLEAESCDILLDEVTGVASSRESMGLPAPVANKLVQLRRADVVVRWSAPAWGRADKIIRECSQAVVYCQGHLPKSAGDVDRLWRQRRFFHWQTYDAQLFEDFTSGKRDQLKPMVNDWHWGPGSPAFGAYDTYDSVSVVGTVTDSGRCYRCGGRRRVPECRCDDHREPRRRTRAEAGAPLAGSPELGGSDVEAEGGAAGPGCAAVA